MGQNSERTDDAYDEPFAPELQLDGPGSGLVRRASAASVVADDERERDIRARLGADHRSGPAMERVVRAIEHAAPTRATVLVIGESGTGKEHVAEIIHEMSPRRRAPFLAIHCASLADTLEAELFGQERGASTGEARREGGFERAHEGTLFLDEIGEIDAATQVKLLRFLQHRGFERVGGTQTLSTDVRVIAATHRDLREEVKKGRFREDLFYRLNVVGIEVPPLRERRGDIAILTRFFLDRFALENGKPIRSISHAALKRIEEHSWPGNVRELENAIERAVVMADGDTLEEEHVFPDVAAVPSFDGAARPATGLTLAEIEKRAILAALDAAGGSTARAAAVLGISVRKVQYRLQEYGLLTPRMATLRTRRDSRDDDIDDEDVGGGTPA